MSVWLGKTAVITGAGSGIGAGLAARAAALGMRVVAADVDQAGLAATAAAAPEAITTVDLDVRDGDALQSLARQVFESHGAVHLLFNNAGVLVDGKTWERSEADWRWTVEVNILGVVNGIRAFVPRMLEQGDSGRVINTASIGGLLAGSQFLGPYQSSKHAVVALTESLYRELALEPAPVSASVLCPGEVATGIWESERLRPEAERHTLGTEAEQAFHNAVAGSVSEGIDPLNFASEVFAGIEADRFWLLPGKDFDSGLEARHQNIMARENPSPQWG